jgi:hypothetical protein
MLKMEAECKHSFREYFYPFSCTWYQLGDGKTSAPLQKT